jgi:hypothetical protein
MEEPFRVEKNTLEIFAVSPTMEEPVRVEKNTLEIFAVSAIMEEPFRVVKLRAPSTVKSSSTTKDPSTRTVLVAVAG